MACDTYNFTLDSRATPQCNWWHTSHRHGAIPTCIMLQSCPANMVQSHTARILCNLPRSN
eukprot:9366818-Ditylum_brightwellii.AAC.1